MLLIMMKLSFLIHLMINYCWFASLNILRNLSFYFLNLFE